MQENRNTVKFILAAGIALVLAWEPWRPGPANDNVPAEVGSKLFPKFESPLAAKSLEIISYDESTATISDFKVAQVNGVWSIPSHSNYPADAREHMAQAATSLWDLEILRIDSNSPGDQELYGVIAPDPTKLRPGMSGVGRRVTLKDDKDNILADLVIGNEVKDQPTQRFVRVADRDQICRVVIRTDKLSTKFEDWIEKDLLKLNAFDVRQVELNDYSTQRGMRRDGSPALRVLERSRAKLAFDDAKQVWTLVDMATFDDEGKAVPSPLAANEELNVEKLNGLKTALDDLKIVDVERKPSGLSQDLRANEDFVTNREAVQSLAERGFYPASRDGNQTEIFSSEGEVTCTTKDGVRYVLRFGALAGGPTESKDEPAGEKKAEDKEKSNPALNRYLFVMAQFDDSQIAKPQFKPVPGGSKPTEGQPADDKTPPADQPAPEGKNDDVPEKKTADDEKADEPAKDAAGDKAAAEKDDEKKDEAEGEKAPPKPTTPEEEQRLAVERENKRMQDDYDAAIKKGQDLVTNLNDRFADWYFIIPESVYKKIHLSRADIVKEKEIEKPKGPVGELKDLEQGLKPGE